MVSDTVRKLFPQLLANGYVPIPNRDKHCYLPKWSTIEVDEWQCHRWSRQTRWPAIGLRMEPPLLVIDLDLPHPDIASAVRDTLPRAVLEEALERIGSPPKTAFFLRMDTADEPFHETHTRRYVNTDKVKFAVQIFAGGGGGHQFGAFGPHSHDEAGNVLKTYKWVDDCSPVEVPIWNLPVISRAETFAILDRAEAVLASWPGLSVDNQSQFGETIHSQVYDLNDEMTFVDAEGVEYTLEELEAEAKARKELRQPEIRITGSFTNDLTSSGSPRCRVHYSVKTGVSITDYKTSLTHRRLLTDDPALPALLAQIFPDKKGA